MRKCFTPLAVAAISVGSFAFLANGHWLYGQAAPGGSTESGTSAQAQDKMAAGQSNVQLPPGVQQSQAKDTKNVQTLLSDVTEAAVSKNGLDNVVSYFAESDRNRLSKDADRLAGEATLNGRIDQLQKDWQAKYNTSLKVDPQVAFGQQFQGFTIVQGEITNPAMLSNWPVSNPGTPGQAGQSGQPGQQGQAGQPSIKQGQQVAIVTFPAAHGLPEVNCSLIQEGNSWRIDIPDNINAQTLHDNLLTQLTSLDEQKNQWPNDSNEASRLTTHRVMMAIYGVQATQGAQPQHMMIQPQGQQQQQQQSGQQSEQQSPQR